MSCRIVTLFKIILFPRTYISVISTCELVVKSLFLDCHPRCVYILKQKIMYIYIYICVCVCVCVFKYKKYLEEGLKRKLRMYSEKISLDLEEEMELGMQLGC